MKLLKNGHLWKQGGVLFQETGLKIFFLQLHKRLHDP